MQNSQKNFCTYVCIYVCTYVCIYVCMYVFMYVRTYVSIAWILVLGKHREKLIIVWDLRFWRIVLDVTPFNLVKTCRSNDLHAFSPVMVWTPWNAAKQLKHCSLEDNSQSSIQYLFVSQLHHKPRLSLEIISVLIIYKSRFYGVDNPGRGHGRAEINRYTTQTRQTVKWQGRKRQ